ncbi:carboxypeptidase-like regulatory domain-containing protein [Mesonia aquimarina]|uniref:carboxypeptidase-like regulatory domain-containing protein n=1 Tax=Mesonia aquimarina TaxID=1504967 RepID=UPI000EF5D821|nr:carboxypeptidase-like regulatory domain-containing protein [Mesonia aquimarina]
MVHFSHISYKKIILLIFIFSGINVSAFQEISSSKNYVQFKGIVYNKDNSEPIASAHLTLDNYNISTLTNENGYFSMKIPKKIKNATVTTTLIGFQSKTIHLDYFSTTDMQIFLNPTIEKLEDVILYAHNDAEEIVQKTMSNKGKKYIDKPLEMTAFYRESIQQRNTNISLSEALIKIHKQPYTSAEHDKVLVDKARKSTDYTRLDTVVLKLRGGPYSTLYIDIMKYPEFLYEESLLREYNFTFNEPTQINGNYVYVINFDQKRKHQPWYYGKLFIDAESLTLIKADYHLNVEDRTEAIRMFVLKKPGKAKVFPVETHYQIDYLNQNGKWYYSYANVFVEMVVNWKKRLFNSRYKFRSELLVTERKYLTEKSKRNRSNLINPSIIMNDNISGFSDADFWGANNIIEPEKSILEAYQKIKDRVNN